MTWRAMSGRPYDEVMAAEVAISMRLEDALEALEAAAATGSARDLASAAAGVMKLGGAAAEDDGVRASSSTGQGLTLVHFSAQPEPFLTQNTP